MGALWMGSATGWEGRSAGKEPVWRGQCGGKRPVETRKQTGKRPCRLLRGALLTRCLLHRAGLGATPRSRPECGGGGCVPRRRCHVTVSRWGVDGGLRAQGTHGGLK